MQHFRKHAVKVGTLIGVLGLCLVLATFGCSSEPNVPDLDPCDGPGVRDCFATMTADMPDINELEPVGPQYAPSDTLDEVYHEVVRLVLSYDSTTDAFTGTMTNTTETTQPNFSIAVYLDTHATPLETSAVNLAPGQAIAVTLPVGAKLFTSWSAQLVVH